MKALEVLIEILCLLCSRNEDDDYLLALRSAKCEMSESSAFTDFIFLPSRCRNSSTTS
jgi:hypothetical protein